MQTTQCVDFCMLGAKGFGHLGTHCVAAYMDVGPNSCHNVDGVGTELGDHLVYSGLNNVGHRASPTRVDGGNNSLDFVTQEYRHTVGC